MKKQLNLRLKFLVEEVGNDNMMLNKEKALYVKICVIQNGVQDSDGDTLDAVDIKRIFTSFNNQNRFEIQHDNLPLEEVSLMENYISKSVETIAGIEVPIGSWNGIIRVDNPDVQDLLLQHEFGGVSLYNRIKKSCQLKLNLPHEATYSQLKDKDCLIPLYISFVKKPANGVGLEIMDYNSYIQKSQKESESRIKEDNSMSLIDKLKSLIEEAEAEGETEAVTTVEEEVVAAEDAPADESEIKKEDEEENSEAEEESDEESEETIEAEETESEETEIQKAEDIVEATTEEDRITALENRIQVIEDKVNELVGLENTLDEEVNPADVADEPVITKSSKIDVNNVENSVNVSEEFYKATNRDPITGKRIRHKSRILN